MGSKGSQTTNTSQQQSYIPTGAGYLTGALNSAQALGQQGTPTIPTAPVAGFNSQQQQAFGLANNVGIQNPYLSAAQNLFSPSGIQSYYNPAVNSVTGQLQNVFGQQQQQNNASLVNAAGGVGADRIAVGQGNLANQQGLAAGQVYSNLWNTAAQQAQSAAYGTAGLGAQAQASNTQDIQNLLGAGGLQQQLSQAQLNAPYQQQLAQMALPYQLQQFYTQNIGALAPSLGGTTVGTGTSQTSYDPSLLSQIFGGGALGLGLLKGIGKGSGGSVGYAGGGGVNPFAFDGGGAAPIDVSQGLFSGSKLFRLPEQSLPTAQAHVPQLSNLTSAPNMSQQGQQGLQGLMGLQALGKQLGGLGGYNNSTSNLFGMSNASQDWLQDQGLLARGGAANPFAHLPHFDGGGGDGGDGGGDGGDGGGGDGGGGIGSDAGAMGEGAASGIASGIGGIGSDTAAAAATGGLNSEDTDDSASLNAAVTGAQEAGLAGFGSALGNFGTAMGTGVNDADSVGAFGPGNLNAMTGITGAFDEGIAGFGPGSVSGPNGVGLGFGTAAAGLGLGNMSGFGTPGLDDDTGGFSSVAMNSPFGMTPNQAVAQSFGDPGTPPGVNAQLGQVAANTGPTGETSPGLAAALSAALGIPGAISSGLTGTVGALSGIPGALSTAATGINDAVGTGLSAIGNLPGSPSSAVAVGDPGTSSPSGAPSPAAVAAALSALGIDGSGYGYLPSGYNPFAQHAARGGAMKNPFVRHYDDGGDVDFNARFNDAMGIAPQPDNSIRLDPQATQAWRQGVDADMSNGMTAQSPFASPPTTDTAPPPAPAPDDASAPAVLHRISNGLPGGAQPAPPPPPPTGGANPFSSSGFFGKQGYLNNLFRDPAAMALIMGGLGAWTPGGISGGLAQGLKLGQGQETIDQAAKKLEEEANAHSAALAKPVPIGQDRYGRTIYGQVDDDGNIKPVDLPSLTGNKAQESDATGDEYLKSLPAAEQRKVIATATGRLPLPNMRSPNGQQLYDEVLSYDPDFQATRYAIRQDFEKGKTAASNNGIRAAIFHANHLSDVFQTLDNKSWPAGNALMNVLRTASGDPRVQDTNQTIGLLAEELTRAYRGSGGAEADINRFMSNLQASQSPAQANRLVYSMVKNLAGKAQSNEAQWQDAFGQDKEFGVLRQNERDVISKLQGRDSPTLPAAAASQLQEGRVTTFGNGQRWRLRNGQPEQVQ